MISEWEREESAPHLRSLAALLDALGCELGDLADAIAMVNGRAPVARRGGVRERWVQALIAEGIDSRGLYALASGAGVHDDPAAAADLVASAAVAAERMAQGAVDRVRSTVADLATKYPQLDAAIGATVNERAGEDIGAPRRRRRNTNQEG